MHDTLTTIHRGTVRPGATGILRTKNKAGTREGAVRINTVESHPRHPGALYVGWSAVRPGYTGTDLGAWGYTILNPDGSNPIRTGFGSTFHPHA